MKYFGVSIACVIHNRGLNKKELDTINSQVTYRFIKRRTNLFHMMLNHNLQRQLNNTKFTFKHSFLNLNENYVICKSCPNLCLHVLNISDLLLRVAPSCLNKMQNFSFRQSRHFLVTGLKGGALSITLSPPISL